MSGLAMIYKKHLNDSDVPQATKKAVTWIKDKILHGYYMTGMEDRYSSFFVILTILIYILFSKLSDLCAECTPGVSIMFCQHV
jgi:hypothetical protein